MADNHVGPAVANMSLGGPYSAAVNDAVSSAVDAGVTMAVAAGNEDQNACNVSPASTAAAITVGATDSGDARAYFSNYGSCVDLFAPGVNITSAWIGSNSATNTISGTSMASPHVAGAVAVYLSNNPGASTTEVADWVTGNAGEGRVSDPAGSPNLLLYTGEGDGGSDPGDPGDPAGCEGENNSSTPLPDRSTTESALAMDCDGNAATDSRLSVDITHTWRGDLEIYLVAPDGSSYQVKDSGWDSGNDVVETYTVDLSAESGTGTWTLRIVDVYSGDSGTLNGWSLTI
ncbi:hypothetical protein GCM10029992_19960 [Glycomyces albus]